ncbi:MAG: hypothetical protein AAGK32_02940 [Actinomycetota bacterium]
MTASESNGRRRWPWLVLGLALVAGAGIGGALLLTEEDEPTASAAEVLVPAPTLPPGTVLPVTDELTLTLPAEWEVLDTAEGGRATHDETTVVVGPLTPEEALDLSVELEPIDLLTLAETDEPPPTAVTVVADEFVGLPAVVYDATSADDTDLTVRTVILENGDGGVVSVTIESSTARIDSVARELEQAST